MFFIVSHARFEKDGTPTHGTASELTTFLQKKDKSYLFIWHSLFQGFSTQVESFDREKIARKFLGIKRLPFLIRVIQEQIINLVLIFLNRKDIKIFIGVDPLNALSGVIAKKMGFIKYVVFYTADYAKDRFKNQVLNWFYHGIDIYSARNSDEVWNVSSRIVDLRISQGIDKNKIFFVPNTPEFSKVKTFSKERRNVHDLVIVSNITKAINYHTIIRAIKNLSQKYTDIRLLIIGTGEYRLQLERLIGKLKLKDKVIFLGRKSHKEVLKILSQSGLGVAIYTNDFPWTEYGDSMKAREYFACGLPTIISDVVSTADDIREKRAGFVLGKDARNFEDVIDKLFSDKNLYKIMKKNAITLAKKYDFTKLMETRLRKFI